MFLRVRRQLRSRIGRWLLYPVLAVLMIASIGGGYQTVRESLDARAYPPPGQLIDVGGHRLHLYCTGTGSPTVVLEPGLWRVVLRFRLDHPGRGPRHPSLRLRPRRSRLERRNSNGPQDGAHIAADLHTLLERAQVPGPYVLAGHSFNGLYVQSFAAQFPDQCRLLAAPRSTPTQTRPGPASQHRPPTTSSVASPP